jgi:murein L,D-transpeptidase YafK
MWGVSFAAVAFLAVIVARTHADPLPADAKANRIVVEKARRVLLLYSGETLLKRYKIALGANPEGHKQQQGDSRTPEGSYVIDYRNPQSSYHLSLHVSYPNKEDKRRAASRGVSPGGDIFIHGLAPEFAWIGAMHVASDWTDGCIAVSNAEIEELWRAVPNGTPIEIRP